ncbi:MAG: hypothetical protein ACRDQ7_01395 [Haloechinothrix sp.]
MDAVVDSSGVPARLVHVAIDYWAAHPDEIEEWIRAADEAETDAFDQWQRRQKLLAS